MDATRKQLRSVRYGIAEKLFLWTLKAMMAADFVGLHVEDGEQPRDLDQVVYALGEVHNFSSPLALRTVV